jgi:hypothetical protein
LISLNLARANPVPGGHPVPGGYKYENLALQVGGVLDETVKYSLRTEADPVSKTL